MADIIRGIFNTPVSAPTTQGPNYAGAVGTNGWSGSTNAVGSEETVCAQTVITATSGNWNTFGFSIPGGVTINGILVELKESVSLGGGAIWTVVLRKSDAGADSGSHTFNETDTTICGSSQLIRSYGGAADLWGTTWTPAEINSAGFTVRVTSTNTDVYFLNWIRVSVTYT